MPASTRISLAVAAFVVGNDAADDVAAAKKVESEISPRHLASSDYGKSASGSSIDFSLCPIEMRDIAVADTD